MIGGRTSNRLLPVLGLGVVGAAVLIGMRSCGPDGVVPSDPARKISPSRAPAPDADSPAETIQTLQASVADMQSRFEVLRTENEQLHAEKGELNRTVTDIREQLRKEAAEKNRSGDTLAGLDSRLRALSDQITSLRTRQATVEAASDIPVGLGLDADSGPPPDAIVWVEPLDGDESAPRGQKQKRGSGFFEAAAELGRSVSGPAARAQPDATIQSRRASDVRPVFTVPRNATLVGSTAMTGLIGRVPVNNTVQDPFPFKVLVGPENLAANGLEIPEVFGMVWSGKARGDWTLSCVTGELHSVTFVFTDGTIRTVSSDQRDGRSGDASPGTGPLGWLSDDQGIPCVTGERISNAAAFLTQRVLLAGGTAAAEAAAAAQTTTQSSALTGATASSVTGDIGRFVLGKTVADASDEVAKWLRERQAQSFDAVFVKPGAKVAIHIDRAIPIDYDPNGRRLNHGNGHAVARRVRLD